MKKSMLVIVALLALSQITFAQNVVIGGVRLSGSGCNEAASSAVVKLLTIKTLSVLKPP